VSLGMVGEDARVRGHRFAWQVVVAAVGCVLLAVTVGWVATALNPKEGVSLEAAQVGAEL
jgi:hypothetical protein